MNKEKKHLFPKEYTIIDSLSISYAISRTTEIATINCIDRQVLLYFCVRVVNSSAHWALILKATHKRFAYLVFVRSSSKKHTRELVAQPSRCNCAIFQIFFFVCGINQYYKATMCSCLGDTCACIGESCACCVKEVTCWWVSLAEVGYKVFAFSYIIYMVETCN